MTATNLTPLLVVARGLLDPHDPHSAGGRLCRVVMKITPDQYVRDFNRQALCGNRWSVVRARRAAASILEGRRRLVILLGSQVCGAFGVPYTPFAFQLHPDLELDHTTTLAILPHPSHLSREWRTPGAARRAHHLLRTLGALDAT